MCNQLGAAPPGVMTPPFTPSVTSTTKNKYSQDRIPACASCHKQTNPMAYGLENIDAVGRWRATDGPLKIDASGFFLNQGTGEERPYAEGGFYEGLANLPEVSACFTLKMYQFALGRGAGTQDKPALDQLLQKFRTNQFKVADLMIDIAKSNEFRLRAKP